MKLPRILYFVDGVSPSPQDYEAASKMTAQVMFRNAQVIPADAALESCDGVAGCVPPMYKDFQTAEEAIAEYSDKMKKLVSKTGDKKAPVVPKAAAQTSEKTTPVPKWTPNA